MKKIKTQFSIPIIFILFFLFAAASTAPMRTTYSKPKPEPCVTHKPLTYSPVLVTIYVSGSYNMKDLSEAQRYVPGILISKLNALTPYKYQLADGVKPNLSLYVTYTSDNYGHFGAEIKGYVYDGDFFKTIGSNFITFEKLDDEVANRVNSLITGGWCNNCPSPCIP